MAGLGGALAPLMPPKIPEAASSNVPTPARASSSGAFASSFKSQRFDNARENVLGSSSVPQGGTTAEVKARLRGRA